MLNILQSIDQKYSKFACDIIIRHLFETDEKLKFSTKSDFEFLIPCLAHCSLNNYTKQIPKIFQVILVRINEYRAIWWLAIVLSRWLITPYWENKRILSYFSYTHTLIERLRM